MDILYLFYSTALPLNIYVIKQPMLPLYESVL
jgi:hypothetical protein